MHKQQGDTGKKFVDDDDVIYIPAKDGDTNTIPELDIKATAVQNPNHTYLVDEDTTDEYDIYETKEDIIFLNHMMRLCGTLCNVTCENRGGFLSFAESKHIGKNVENILSSIWLIFLEFALWFIL
ncbi:MAG: hypothetical protein BYD32DRAFT_435430 [Podila humilis]|nr:MAG: hypothetical protein BYD32DRAFT_435430 [Podila humilis]